MQDFVHDHIIWRYEGEGGKDIGADNLASPAQKRIYQKQKMNRPRFPRKNFWHVAQLWKW